MTVTASVQPRRTALYTPPTSLKLIANAVSSAADVVIFDLEDAIAPAAKQAAREMLCKGLAQLGSPRKEVVVRVNGIGTPWCRDDLEAACRFDISAILFPKIESAVEVQAATALLESSCAYPGMDLWCMIETPLAILNAQDIAETVKQPSSRMKVWVMGTNDLAKLVGTRLSSTRDTLVPYLATALLAARAYGLMILDGVHNDIKDSDGFQSACEEGAAMGFDGKTVIHPSQIDFCNRLYSPSEEEIAQARTIVAAFRRPENKDAGVLQVEGKMVELLHAEIAQRTIDIADAIALVEPK
jgi:citrate lyase subunit beta/citryl-CoA lyase